MKEISHDIPLEIRGVYHLRGLLQPAGSTTTRKVYLPRGQPYGIIPVDHRGPLVYPAFVRNGVSMILLSLL